MSRYKRLIDVPERAMCQRIIRELARRGVPYKANNTETNGGWFIRILVRPGDLCFAKTIVDALKNTKEV